MSTKVNPLAKVIARMNVAPGEASRRSNVGKAIRGTGVQDSPDLQRIKNLPETNWQDDENLEALGEGLKEVFGRTPPDPCTRECACRGSGDMSLRAIQSAGLQDIHNFGGAICAMRVGSGKTLLSFLAGTVVEADRVLLVLPADLKRKTRRAFEKLSRHWQGPKKIKLMSYEKLSRQSGLKELVEYMPDLVVADEAHRFKNKRAACTIHMNGYLKKVNPKASYVDMSGTWMDRSIMEIHHRMQWALPPPLYPLPVKYNEAQDWADAVDERVGITGRITPGALTQFYTQEDCEELVRDGGKENVVKITRNALRRKIMGTPGIVGTADVFDSDVSILIRAVEWDLSPAVQEAFKKLRETWTTPDGDTIDSASRLWQVAGCLVQGFYYRMDPPPPDDWLDARRMWGSAVRSTVANGKYYTPLMVTQATDRGELPHMENMLARWRDIKDSYDPKKHRKTQWLGDGATNFCIKWAKKNKGIIWVQEQALGRRLHVEAGIPYYASEGMCGKKMIEDETQTCVASVAANHKGRNLQYNFSKNLIVTPVPGGAKMEQLLGRTHREGQTADNVTADVGINCFENWDVFRQSRYDAEFQESMSGQNQKLTFADVDVIEAEEASVRAKNEIAWDKRNADFFQSWRNNWSEENFEVSALSSVERQRLKKEKLSNLT